MAEKQDKKKRKGRKAYLNDIRPNLAGEYVYVGNYYCYVPNGKSCRRAVLEILALSLLSLLALVAAGFVNAGGMSNSFYVIIPYMAEAISVFVLLWAVSKILVKGEKLREYVYGASILRIPPACLFCSVFALAGIAAIAVFLIINGADGSAGEIALLLAAKLAAAAAPLLLRRLMKTLKWELELQ